MKIYFCLTWTLLLFSCTKEKEETYLYRTTPYSIELPFYFPQMDIPKSNPLTVEGIKLGNQLYNDPLLSKDGPMEGLSCSSCHVRKYGYTSPGTTILSHVNLAWNNYFLWNGKIEGTLEKVALFEVEDFFGTNTALLQKDIYYPSLFYQVFESNIITSKQIAYALAQYLRSLTSFNSKYDQFILGKAQLTEHEENGLNLFFSEKGDCFHCHTMALLTDGSFHNIGLDSEFNGTNDRFSITMDSNDIGKYKTPSLRNTALHPPYMHDGRFNTLEDVIRFYNSGVKKSNTLDPIMTKEGKEFGLRLSEQEILDLVAFLHTLTDSTFISDN